MNAIILNQNPVDPNSFTVDEKKTMNINYTEKERNEYSLFDSKYKASIKIVEEDKNKSFSENINQVLKSIKDDTLTHFTNNKGKHVSIISLFQMDRKFNIDKISFEKNTILEILKFLDEKAGKIEDEKVVNNIILLSFFSKFWKDLIPEK